MRPASCSPPELRSGSRRAASCNVGLPRRAMILPPVVAADGTTMRRATRVEQALYVGASTR
jgi:hypothetical protein